MMFRSTLPRFVAVFAAALIVLAVAGGTAVASTSAIYQACRDGGSMSGFSKSDLQSALDGVPADLDDYYGCSAQINAALIAKATSNIPGGTGKGVKGTRAKLRAATTADLTTPADRKKAEAAVDKELTKASKSPLSATTDPAIHTGAGQTLASTVAPGVPVALIIGMLGLILLLGVELAGRLGKMPRLTKSLPWSGRRGGH